MLGTGLTNIHVIGTYLFGRRGYNSRGIRYLRLPYRCVLGVRPRQGYQLPDVDGIEERSFLSLVSIKTDETMGLG